MSFSTAPFDLAAFEKELGPACSLQELLAVQIAAAQKVIAASQAINARLEAGGTNHVARPPTAGPQLKENGAGCPALAQRQKAQAARMRSLGGGGKAAGTGGLGEPLLGVTLAQVEPDDKGSVLVRKPSRREYKERIMAIFPDPEAVKQQVRQVLLTDSSYNVENFYHKTGFWQALARNSFFKNITFVVITLSSLWIAYDTDYNKADVLTDAPWQFQVVENVFCTFFAFEIFTRYMAFAKKRDAFRDGWFLFDGALSASMMFDVWLMPLLDMIGGPDNAPSFMRHTAIFRLLRVFRLARVGRLARLLKNFPELMVLVKGMCFAMRAVFSTLCLLGLVIYVFAIAFTQTLQGTEAAQGCFENVPMSMNCLLLQGVFADQAQLISNMLSVHWSYYIAVLLYMVIGSMTLLNMLIGVMCEVVTMVSEAEKETIMHQGLKDTIAKIISSADADNDNLITHSEFKHMLSCPIAAQALSDANIDVVGLVDFVEEIFQDKMELEMDEFVEAILQFRSDNTATVKDIIDCRRQMLAELDSMIHQG